MTGLFVLLMLCVLVQLLRCLLLEEDEPRSAYLDGKDDELVGGGSASRRGASSIMSSRARSRLQLPSLGSATRRGKPGYTRAGSASREGSEAGSADGDVELRQLQRQFTLGDEDGDEGGDDDEARFELTVPSDAGPERRVRIDLPSGLRIRVALPQGAVPDAVVSFNLPDEVVRSLDATDTQALYSMAFDVELDEAADEEAAPAAAPSPPQQSPSPPQQRRECRPGLLYSEAAAKGDWRN